MKNNNIATESSETVNEHKVMMTSKERRLFIWQVLLIKAEYSIFKPNSIWHMLNPRVLCMLNMLLLPLFLYCLSNHASNYVVQIIRKTWHLHDYTLCTCFFDNVDRINFFGFCVQIHGLNGFIALNAVQLYA